MIVNGIAFLTTLSQNLQLGTVEQLLTQTATQLSNSLIKIVKLYPQPGSIVRIIMVDQEFDKVKEACNTVEINTIEARKLVGKIEQLS